MAIAAAGAGVDQDDVTGLQDVTDAVELRLHLGRRHPMAVGQGAEVEFHTAAETPLQRYLVDGDGPLAVVHGGVVVPGRIHVGAGMSGGLEEFDRAALPLQQLVRRDAEGLLQLPRALQMIEVADAGPHARGIGSDTGLQRDGQVDDLAHGFS